MAAPPGELSAGLGGERHRPAVRQQHRGRDGLDDPHPGHLGTRRLWARAHPLRGARDGLRPGARRAHDPRPDRPDPALHQPALARAPQHAAGPDRTLHGVWPRLRHIHHEGLLRGLGARARRGGPARRGGRALDLLARDAASPRPWCCSPSPFSCSTSCSSSSSSRGSPPARSSIDPPTPEWAPGGSSSLKQAGTRRSARARSCARRRMRTRVSNGSGHSSRIDPSGQGSHPEERPASRCPASPRPA